MAESFGPMETMFQEIEAALSVRLYFLAILASLAIPDVCAALISSNGESSGKKYKAWYRANLAATYPRLTDVDFWSLRCGLVHQGRFGHRDMQYDRVIFTFPDTAFQAHNSPIQWPDITYLMMDAPTFCRDVVVAGRKWFSDNENDPVVQKNLDRLVRLRLNGLPPRITGAPIIA